MEIKLKQEKQKGNENKKIRKKKIKASQSGRK